jgi:transcription antitermination factor NusG
VPILPPEPYRHPPELFEATLAPNSAGAEWWVLHTKPRVEKTLARRLLKGGHTFFLPLLIKRNVSPKGGRVRDSYVPLFPGYVFLYGSSEVRLAVLTTNLIVQALTVAEQDRLYLDLANVHRLMTLDKPLTPEKTLPPGMRVEITEGPFAGLTGKVLRRGASWHLLVEVRFLQSGVSVEIEQWMVKPTAADERPLAGGLE